MDDIDSSLDDYRYNEKYFYIKLTHTEIAEMAGIDPLEAAANGFYCPFSYAVSLSQFQMQPIPPPAPGPLPCGTYTDNVYPKIASPQDYIAQARLTQSRWMGSVPDANRLSSEHPGFFFGWLLDRNKTMFCGKSQDDDGHIVCFGGSGTGKTSVVVRPTLMMWKGRKIYVVIKPDGNNYDTTSQGPIQEGERRTVVFNPTKENTARYDPFDILREGGEDCLNSNARELALSLLPTPEKYLFNQVWIQLAQNLLTAAILYFFDLGASFSDMMLAIQQKSVKDLVEEILKSQNKDAASEFDSDTIAALYLSKLCGLKPEQKEGAGMDLASLIPLAVDSQLVTALSADEGCPCIRWSDFLSDEKPYDVILEIPEHKLEQWAPLLQLMLNQLVKTLERRPDKHSPDGKALMPLLVLLDEFPRLGTCHAIENGITTLRSRQVTLAIFVQSLAQLDQRYGAEGRKTILSNCSYKLILGVTEPEDQDYFSRLIGTREIIRSTPSMACDPQMNEVRSVNVQFNKNEEFCVKPHELGFLDNEAILLTPSGACRLKKADYSEFA